MKQSIAILYLAILIATVSGCGEKPAEESPSPPLTAITSWPATRLTDGGNFSLRMQPVDGELIRNQHFSLKIFLEPTSPSATAGDFPKDLEVVVDADMPAHRHGMNTQPKTDGNPADGYRTDGMLFHMAGDWVITVTVSAGGKSESALFPVHIE